MSQHGVTLLKWDPSGHLLATCANEPHLKLWSQAGDGGGLTCHHDIVHTHGVVNVMEWCPRLGAPAHPKILFARYEHISVSVTLGRLKRNYLKFSLAVA